jgi:hypothetical protein
LKQIPANVEIDVNGKLQEVDTVSEDLFIDEDNLNEEYIKQPGTFAWYAVLTAEAEAYRDKLKFDLEVLAADLDKQVREEIELRGDKVTEKLVETEVGRKQEYRNKKEELLEANRQLNVMKAVKEGLVQKKDMLISLGANMRNEKDSSVRILQEEAKTKTKASAVKRKVRAKKNKELND